MVQGENCDEAEEVEVSSGALDTHQLMCTLYVKRMCVCDRPARCSTQLVVFCASTRLLSVVLSLLLFRSTFSVFNNMMLNIVLVLECTHTMSSKHFTSWDGP